MFRTMKIVLSFFVHFLTRKLQFFPSFASHFMITKRRAFKFKKPKIVATFCSLPCRVSFIFRFFISQYDTNEWREKNFLFFLHLFYVKAFKRRCILFLSCARQLNFFTALTMNSGEIEWEVLNLKMKRSKHFRFNEKLCFFLAIFVVVPIEILFIARDFAFFDFAVVFFHEWFSLKTLFWFISLIEMRLKCRREQINWKHHHRRWSARFAACRRKRQRTRIEIAQNDWTENDEKNETRKKKW